MPLTNEQLDLLRHLLARLQDDEAQPPPPKRFSKGWGQQPMHLFFDLPQVLNP